MKIPETATPFLGEPIIANHLFPEGPASRGAGGESDVAHTAGISWGRDQQACAGHVVLVRWTGNEREASKERLIFPHGIEY